MTPHSSKKTMVGRTGSGTALQSSQAEKDGFRALLDCIPDPVFVVSSADETIVYCNVAAARWQRDTERTLIGRPFRDIFAAVSADSREDLLDRVRVDGQVFVEQSFRLSTGEIVRADLSASMLQWGHESLVIAILRDAEFRLAAQEREIEAREVASQLATIARLSHEINNPLQALMMCASRESDSEVRLYADEIAAVVRKLRAGEGERVSAGAGTLTTPPASPDPSIVPADPLRILIADDSKPIRTFLRLLLSRAFPDAQVETAADGEEALEAFTRGHALVIVLDVLMPKKTGDVVFEDILRFCREHRWEEPRIAFCTGYTPPAAILAVLQDSSHYVCLLKPFPPEEIIKTVRHLADRTVDRT